MIFHCPFCKVELVPGVFILNNVRDIQYYDCKYCPYLFYIGFNEQQLFIVSVTFDNYRVVAKSDTSKVLQGDRTILAQINKSYMEWPWHDIQEFQQEVKTVITFS